MEMFSVLKILKFWGCREKDISVFSLVSWSAYDCLLLFNSFVQLILPRVMGESVISWAFVLENFQLRKKAWNIQMSEVFLTMGAACRQTRPPRLWSPGLPGCVVPASDWWRQQAQLRTCEQSEWKHSHRPDARCHSPALTAERPVRRGCCRSVFCPQCHWNLNRRRQNVTRCTCVKLLISTCHYYILHWLCFQ